MPGLGPVADALAAPFLDPGSRTWWVALVLAAGVAVAVQGGARAAWTATWGGLWTRSGRLDVELLVSRQLLRALGALPAGGAGLGVAFTVTRTLDDLFGAPKLHVPAASLAVLYTVALFVAWDLSRYALHRAMHEVPALWAFHQVHHSASRLTPLTFHRLHPVESLLYAARGALVTGVVAGLFFWGFRGAATPWTLLGVHAVGLVFDAVSGNLRHSEVGWTWGRVERWLLSPAQHQVHHGADPAFHGTNYGTWLALWDRLGGTWRAGDVTPDRYGVDDRNHDDGLVSAWLGPFVQLSRGVRRWGLLGAAPAAAAQEVAPTPPPDEPAYTIVVTDDDGVPTVAGSAQVLTEADLRRFDHDDIHRVLSSVPGVTVREEDGFGLRPNIGIRGVSSDRSSKIALLDDGVPLSPAPYAAPAAYYFPLTSRIVGVEVFKGPAAIQHGPQTVGGAVNLRSREVPREGTDGGVDIGVGLRETVRSHGWVGGGGRRGGWLLEAAQLGSGGFKQLPSGGPTGFSRYELVGKGVVDRIGGGATRRSVELRAGLSGEHSYETYLGLSPSDAAQTPYLRYAASDGDEMTWTRTEAVATWRMRRSDAWDARVTAYHHRLDRVWTKLNGFADGPSLHDLLVRDPTSAEARGWHDLLTGARDGAGPEDALMRGTNDRLLENAGVDGRLRFELGTAARGATVELGSRLHHDHVERLHTEAPHTMREGRLVPDDVDPTVLLDAVTTATASASHAIVEARFGDVTLSPGTRVEVVRTTRADEALPIEKAQIRATMLPGLGGTALVAPDVRLYGGVHRGMSPVAPGQPSDVRPELAWNAEFGARASRGPVYAELGGFASDYQNLVGQCTLSGGCEGDATDRQFNGGRARVVGLEGIVKGEPALGAVTVPFEVTWATTHGAFRTGFVSDFPQFGTVAAGDRLPYVPLHQGAARAGVSHRRGAVDVGATWRSGMLDAAGVVGDGTPTVPSLLLVDASARVTLSPTVTATIRATNLTNRRSVVSWQPYGARPTAPPQVVVGVRFDPR
jgi:Fe(3+) dicitrate transport protein